MNLSWYRRFPRLTFLARRIAGANYEREMALLRVLCDRAATGIDVGAKVGMYTYRIRNWSADVLAFEPIPVLNRFLRTALGGRRVRIEPYAVSNVSGTTKMRLPFNADGKPELGRSTIDAANSLCHRLVARTEEIQVQTRRIDDYELPSVGFIKIDVEGHELSVLGGAERTIEKHRPNLLIECNDDHQPDGRRRLVEWLTEREYVPLFLADRAIHGIEHYCRDRHWAGQHIENVIGVHRSRADLQAQLSACARSARHWYTVS